MTLRDGLLASLDLEDRGLLNREWSGPTDAGQAMIADMMPPWGRP